MAELTESDRERIAVAGDTDVDEVAVGGVGAARDRRHPSVDGIEAVRLAHEVRGRLRGAADATHLRRPVGRDVQLEEGLDDRGRHGVMAAAGAERRHRPLVIASR